MKRLVDRLRGRGQTGSQPDATAEPDVTAHPTPIRISKRTRTVLMLVGLALLGLVIWREPSVLTTVVGGFALALALSFPVRWLSRLMPRGLAILVSFLLLVGLIVLAALFLVPLVVEQFPALVRAVPDIANTVERYLSNALDSLQERGLLPSDPQQVISRVREDLVDAVKSLAGNVLGGAFGVVTGTFSFAVTLFGVIFIGAYLLVDVRRFEAVFLSAAPHGYRRDAKTLWDAFGYSLSRYLGGLALVLAIQGAVSAVGLFLLGVPYALVLGAFVSVAAVIPYLGAWLSAIPAVLVALTVSPTTALLTALLFLGIQQLEGNFLTPKIQGNTLRVHPVLVFLAVLKLVTSRTIAWISWWVGLDQVFAFLWGLLRIPVALLLLSLVVSAVYRVARNRHLTLRSVVPGALLAVALWALASLAFAFGLTLFPDYGAVYGSLGAAISLLLYLYVSASAVLLGAEVNAAMPRGSSCAWR